MGRAERGGRGKSVQSDTLNGDISESLFQEKRVVSLPPAWPGLAPGLSAASIPVGCFAHSCEGRELNFVFSIFPPLPLLESSEMATPCQPCREGLHQSHLRRIGSRPLDPGIADVIQ